MAETLEMILFELESFTSIPLYEELTPLYDAIQLSTHLSFLCMVASCLTFGLVLGALVWRCLKR